MKVGILGNGQLSRMLALAGIPMGIDFRFYGSVVSECTKNLGDNYVGDFADTKKLAEFAADVDVITCETESIPIATLEFLETQANVYPRKEAFALMQDRWLEKKLFTELDIPTNDFMLVDTAQDLERAAQEYGYPFVLKKRKNNYDGRGQRVIKSDDELKRVDDVSECIAESFLDFSREVSIIGARNLAGDTMFYDLSHNIHQDGILIQAKNSQHDEKYNDAVSYLNKLMTHTDYVGVCTLEFFEKDNTLYANEAAPRVHNSGHWTIEGAYTSQFENHLRAILNLKLGNSASHSSTTIFNILGNMPKLEEVINERDVYYHDYKKAPRPGRKIGHITHVG